MAKYDYKSEEDEMSFKKGDKFFITDDDMDDDWWFATAKRSGQEGSIPRNYVAMFGSLDAEE